MEKKGTRRVDGLGRIVLPADIRQFLCINIGDYVEFFVDYKENMVIIRKYGGSCIFCNSVENLKNFDNKLVCEKCISKILELR